MTLNELLDRLTELGSTAGDADVGIRLVAEDEVTGRDVFHFAPIYEVRVDDGKIVISGVPQELAKRYGLDE